MVAKTAKKLRLVTLPKRCPSGELHCVRRIKNKTPTIKWEVKVTFNPLVGWIIHPDAMSTHSGDVLMRRVEGGKAVTQTADQCVKRLIGDSGSLFISPNRCYKTSPA